jgi:signal peptidase
VSRYWNYLMTALQVAGVLLVAALLVGQFLGQPVLLGYVTSGSMEPTLQTGDGFVAVPAAVGGPVEIGDVVVFQAERVNDGQLTTHRVVGETGQGFITQGDANAVTDQVDGEPPVTEAQIVAKAATVRGDVVVIPNLGVVVEGTKTVVSTAQRRLAALLGTGSLLGTQGVLYIVFGLSVGAYVIDILLSSGRETRKTRERTRDGGVSPHLLAALLTLVVVSGATAAMVGPAGPQQFDVVSSDFDSPRPTVLEAGTSDSIQYTIPNSGALPVYVFLKPGSEGVEVEPAEHRIGPSQSVNSTVTITAPPETGYYQRYVVEHRYIALLPQSQIRTLYEMHAWLPVIVIDLMVGVPFYILGISLMGTERIRRREGRDLPMLSKTRRALGHLWR